MHGGTTKPRLRSLYVAEAAKLVVVTPKGHVLRDHEGELLISSNRSALLERTKALFTRDEYELVTYRRIG